MTQQQFQHQRPVVDLLVAIIAVPTLIVFALQLEKNMQNKWADDASTKWIVLGLGVGMLIISLLICGYVTHRMGVCLWTGPLEDTTPTGPTLNHVSLNYYNLQNLKTEVIYVLFPIIDSITKRHPQDN